MTGAGAVRALGVVCARSPSSLPPASCSADAGGSWRWSVRSARLTGRTGALVHAVATLALVGAAAGAGETWLVPLLVLGIVASVECSASAGRSTRVRPRPAVGSALATPLLAAGAAAAVLALAELAPAATVPTALAASLAAATLLATTR